MNATPVKRARVLRYIQRNGWTTVNVSHFSSIARYMGWTTKASVRHCLEALIAEGKMVRRVDYEHGNRWVYEIVETRDAA
jgi:hypothetical protein